MNQVKECFSAYQAELSVVYYARAQSIFCRCVYLTDIGTFHNAMPLSISKWSCNAYTLLAHS